MAAHANYCLTDVPSPAPDVENPQPATILIGDVDVDNTVDASSSSKNPCASFPPTTATATATATSSTVSSSSVSSSSQHHHHAMEVRLGERAAQRLYSSSASSSSMNKNSKHHPSPPNNMNNQGVTVFARHKIQPGKEKQFEAWVHGISQLQQNKYPGFGGAQVVRPTCSSSSSSGEGNEFVSIFRYDNYDHLQTFMDSQDRRRFLEKTCDFAAAPIELTYHSLEYWFVDNSNHAFGSCQQDNNNNKTDPAFSNNVPSPPPQRPPSRPKMVIVTFLLIWGQSHFLRPAVQHWLGKSLAPLGIEALTTFLIVLGTTYLWMPIVTKYILHWWLFPTPPRVPAATTIQAVATIVDVESSGGATTSGDP